MAAGRGVRALGSAWLLALALAWAPAMAESKRLGVFKDWTAMRFTEDGGRSCMMWSQPQESEGDYKRRGEVFVFVTHRPAEGRFDRISFETGYTFEERSTVAVQVDGEAYTLSTDGSMAWTRSDRDDRKLVAAMRAGRSMVVEGTSSRGTRTRDTYSLYGFTAAYRAISAACERDS